MDGNNSRSSRQPRANSSDSKQGLPSYDGLMLDDLPNYEEAEALRLNPKFLDEQWKKRHSMPTSNSLLYISNMSNADENERRPSTDSHNGILGASPRPPPTYEDDVYVDARNNNNEDEQQPPPPRRFSSVRLSRPSLRPRDLSRSSSGRSIASGSGSSLGSGIFRSSRPTTSLTRFEDVPEVHLATVSSRVASRRSPMSRPQTTTIFIRSYSSSSFESDRDDDDANDDESNNNNNSAYDSSDWDDSYSCDDSTSENEATQESAATSATPANRAEVSIEIEEDLHV